MAGPDRVGAGDALPATSHRTFLRRWEMEDRRWVIFHLRSTTASAVAQPLPAGAVAICDLRKRGQRSEKLGSEVENVSQKIFFIKSGTGVGPTLGGGGTGLGPAPKL